MHLSVFREHHDVDSVAKLRALLDRRHEGKYGAFWLSRVKDSCPAIALFINDDEACMFYIREEGDSGFHSLGSEPENFADEVDFVIDNFQMDAYPRAMVIAKAQALSAFEDFFFSGTQPAGINWLEA